MYHVILKLKNLPQNPVGDFQKKDKVNLPVGANVRKIIF